MPLIKYLLVVLLSIGFCHISLAQCPENPIEKPLYGYGAQGPYTRSFESFQNSKQSSYYQTYVYYPDREGPSPVVFMSHAFNTWQSSFYFATIFHLNSIGYTVVFPQYPTMGLSKKKHTILWNGFKEAVQKYPEYIDSSQIIFYGHSFGGGANPRMALNAIREGWGEAGVGIYTIAPWYSLFLSDENLIEFPDYVKMVMMVMADDQANDHEMALDVFHNISIPESEKAYYILSSDSEDDCALIADHAMPMEARSGVKDGLDFWNWYHLDAFIDYTLNGNLEGKEIALGGGIEMQTYWGTWWTGRDYTPIEVTDDPQPSNPSDTFFYPCDSRENPRAHACGTRKDSAIVE